RVPKDAALDYWVKRFDRLDVKHDGITQQFGKKTLSFVDFDDQHYQLISDESNQGVESGTPWQKGPIPLEHAITGLGPVFVRISDFDFLKDRLETVLMLREMDQENDYHLFEMGDGGNGDSTVVKHYRDLPRARQGYGCVHHAAFRVAVREELDQWI